MCYMIQCPCAYCIAYIANENNGIPLVNCDDWHRAYALGETIEDRGLPRRRNRTYPFPLSPFFLYPLFPSRLYLVSPLPSQFRKLTYL